MKTKGKKRNPQKTVADDEEEEQWEVEYIQKARVKATRKDLLYWEYYVKWLGWTHKWDSWEPIESFAHDSDIVEDFWLEIDDCYNTSSQILKNMDIMFAGREVSPSEEWIQQCKGLAVAATDMPLPAAPDPRAVSPFHEDARREPAPVTAAESIWQQAAHHLDDDPDSQSSESSENSEDESDDDFYHAGWDDEESPGTPQRRYAEIPDAPRHYYRRDRPLPQDVQPEDLDTPQGLHRRTNDSRMQPSTTLFVNPTRDAGVLRANSRRELESHRRGPVSRRPEPIRLFTREEMDNIDIRRYEMFASLQRGASPTAEDNQDSDSEEEARPSFSGWTAADGGQPSSPVLSEGEIPEDTAGGRQPLFYAADDDDDGMYIDDPPASSPIPASPSPQGTPTAARRFTILGPAMQEEEHMIVDVDRTNEDTAMATATGASIDIEELINTDYLGGAEPSESVIAWAPPAGPGRLQSEDSTLSSTVTATAEPAGQDREEGNKQTVVVLDELVDSEMEEGEIRE